MTALATDDSTYDLIASSLKLTKPTPLLEDEHAGKPLVKFIIDRPFSRSAQIVAYNFIIDFYQLTGTQILHASAQDGCISVVLRLDSHVDYSGIDIRHLIVSRSSFHDLLYRYDVSKIYFSGFPNSSNFDSAFKIGREGSPIRP
ncbi:hypothetical protein [Bradyrhizobium sp. ORS 285]|uniref:hypothetical protein n=1 Tax=Bradyrhizobium sp. ORS 285 TaxID=115808 RepID=UPI00111219AA|nr:hypothetical protein [Bradyrhizobium sp. ORS 285]